MRSRSIVVVTTLWLATGCVGVIDGTETQSARRDGGRGTPARDAGTWTAPPGEDGGPPPLDEPDAMPPPLDVDAGLVDTLPDAGASMPDAGVSMPDAGMSMPDAGAPVDPCGGLTLAGRCDGNVARWCEGGVIREQSCADGCGAVDGRQRCLPPPPPPACASPIEAEELALTNAARRAAGLGELRCDEGLARAARLHSQDMCNQNYFSHTSLDGRTFTQRISAQGVTWRTAAENIARGQRTAAAVHDAWMNSDGHRRNILNGAFGRIGIGYVECGGRPLWTQNFAN